MLTNIPGISVLFHAVLFGGCSLAQNIFCQIVYHMAPVLKFMGKQCIIKPAAHH